MTTQSPITITSHTQDLTAWLVAQRNHGATPDQIADRLVADGWDADRAAEVSVLSLRRTDRAPLTYSALCFGAGFALLGTGTAAHLALAGNPAPASLAFALTVAIVCAPIAGVAQWFARHQEARSDHVLWSPVRRSLFAVLASCIAVVGLFRLLAFTYQTIAILAGARPGPVEAADITQVLVTLTLAGPSFAWALWEWRRSNVARRPAG